MMTPFGGPVLKRIFFCLLLVTGSSAVAASDYCSLVVRVLSPEGVVLSGIPIVVTEASGVVVLGSTENGEAQFCGLGIRPVTIKVGRTTCNQVLVQTGS